MGTGTVIIPIKCQEQGPQWREEGLLDAGQASVLGGGRIQAFESQEGQREQPVCREQSRHNGAVGTAGPSSPRLAAPGGHPQPAWGAQVGPTPAPSSPTLLEPAQYGQRQCSGSWGGALSEPPSTSLSSSPLLCPWGLGSVHLEAPRIMPSSPEELRQAEKGKGKPLSEGVCSVGTCKNFRCVFKTRPEAWGDGRPIQVTSEGIPSPLLGLPHWFLENSESLPPWKGLGSHQLP